MRVPSSIAMLSTSVALAVGCGGKEGDDESANGSGLSPDDVVTTDASVSLDADCPDVDFSARLADALRDCGAPTPTGTSTPLATFVVGRWLWCSPIAIGGYPPGQPIAGPLGSVGVEFTGDGRAFFLRLACDGTIVRGTGGHPTDSGPIGTWANTYAVLGESQITLYAADTAESDFAEAKWDDSPKRMLLNQMGVLEAMYVVAPDRI